ncbi:transcriptional regulator [Lactiplantibacillus garii]|uniref:Transcriptional regulator n=1 Tax=Lactiplantibacillus garii TaxID=2306423 RepID=A0A3R8KF11_9LACO|nr:helix-turn-helix domain-containing protein [Lactiplantibacillus garii]RRK10678.1 transcriptional regulator [Lactiplantibacillus garii]
MQRYRYDCEPGCPVVSTLQIIAGKWKAVLIYHLMHHTVLRFHDFHRLLPALQPRMLARQLHELEADGIIQKTIYPVMPPKTEYRLTDLGRSLEPIISEMAKWGQRYNEINPDLATN